MDHLFLVHCSILNMSDRNKSRRGVDFNWWCRWRSFTSHPVRTRVERDGFILMMFYWVHFKPLSDFLVRVLTVQNKDHVSNIVEAAGKITCSSFLCLRPVLWQTWWILAGSDPLLVDLVPLGSGPWGHKVRGSNVLCSKWNNVVNWTFTAQQLFIMAPSPVF